MQKIKIKIFQWIAKLAVFAVPSVGAYMILIHLFGMEYLMEEAGDFGRYGSLVLLGFGAVAFILYDLFLGIFNPFYDQIIKPKIRRRMK